MTSIELKLPSVLLFLCHDLVFISPSDSRSLYHIFGDEKWWKPARHPKKVSQILLHASFFLRHLDNIQYRRSCCPSSFKRNSINIQSWEFSAFTEQDTIQKKPIPKLRMKRRKHNVPGLSITRIFSPLAWSLECSSTLLPVSCLAWEILHLAWSSC